MDLSKAIIRQLPYEHPFLFVDEISHLDESGCEGFYIFRKDEFFYRGHFKNHPVTPGVILTECMAQIGLVCLGIFLVQGSKRLKVESSKLKVEGPVSLSDPAESGIVSKGVAKPDHKKDENVSLSASAERRSVSKGELRKFVFSESNVLFEKAVYPGEKVKVVSRKKYWRLGKLKCQVEMFNSKEERVCSGQLSGIMA